MYSVSQGVSCNKFAGRVTCQLIASVMTISHLDSLLYSPLLLLKITISYFLVSRTIQKIKGEVHSKFGTRFLFANGKLLQ